MKTLKSINFFFVIIAFIMILTLYNQFDWELMKFKNNALAAIYLITLGICFALIVKDIRKKNKAIEK